MVQCATVEDHKAVKATFEGTLQGIYLHASNFLKSAFSSVVEQALGEVVRSGSTPTASEGDMGSLVYKKAVFGTILY